MMGYVVPHIPLIQDLTKDPITAGSNIMVEFDAASQWYAASITIAAGWIKTGGRALYLVSSQPPNNVRSQFNRLGLKTGELEGDDKLRITDVYTATLGRASQERYAWESVNVADLRLRWAKSAKEPKYGPEWLRIADDHSVLARFNGEKAWVEAMISRHLPLGPTWKSTAIIGYIRGVHSDWLYNQLEAAYDGVIDIKLDQSGEETRNLVRIRNLRNVAFDSRWHRLKISENFEVMLEK